MLTTLIAGPAVAPVVTFIAADIAANAQHLHYTDAFAEATIKYGFPGAIFAAGLIAAGKITYGALKALRRGNRRVRCEIAHGLNQLKHV